MISSDTEALYDHTGRGFEELCFPFPLDGKSHCAPLLDGISYCTSTSRLSGQHLDYMRALSIRMYLSDNCIYACLPSFDGNGTCMETAEVHLI